MRALPLESAIATMLARWTLDSRGGRWRLLSRPRLARRDHHGPRRAASRYRADPPTCSSRRSRCVGSCTQRMGDAATQRTSDSTGTTSTRKTLPWGASRLKSSTVLRSAIATMELVHATCTSRLGDEGGRAARGKRHGAEPLCSAANRHKPELITAHRDEGVAGRGDGKMHRGATTRDGERDVRTVGGMPEALTAVAR